MEQALIQKLKDKMLEYLYLDCNGVLSRYGDMIEIGLELKCDEETAKMLAHELHSEGLIQMVDPYTFEAYMTKSGFIHLQSLYNSRSCGMKSLDPKTPDPTKLGDYHLPDHPL